MPRGFSCVPPVAAADTRCLGHTAAVALVDRYSAGHTAGVALVGRYSAGHTAAVALVDRYSAGHTAAVALVDRYPAERKDRPAPTAAVVPRYLVEHTDLVDKTSCLSFPA